MNSSQEGDQSKPALPSLFEFVQETKDHMGNCSGPGLLPICRYSDFTDDQEERCLIWIHNDTIYLITGCPSWEQGRLAATMGISLANLLDEWCLGAFGLDDVAFVRATSPRIKGLENYLGSTHSLHKETYWAIFAHPTDHHEGRPAAVHGG